MFFRKSLSASGCECDVVTITMNKVLAAAAHWAHSMGRISSIEFRIVALTNPSDPVMGTVMPVLSHTCQFVCARKLLVARSKEVLVLDVHTRSLLALTNVADSLLEIGVD